MSTSAATLLHPESRPAEAVALVRPVAADRVNPRRRWLPAVSMLTGSLVVLAGAGLALSRSGDASGAVRSVEMPAPAVTTAGGPLAVTLSGPGDVTVLNQVYEPGKDSGWHAHPGIHAVAVLSGSLTIYDEGCARHTYGPGESYVGGQLTHLVRNETGVPVEMVVTYLNPAGPHDSNRRVAPPAGCAASGS